MKVLKSTETLKTQDSVDNSKFSLTEERNKPAGEHDVWRDSLDVVTGCYIGAMLALCQILLILLVKLCCY